MFVLCVWSFLCAMYLGAEVLHVRVPHAACCYMCVCTTYGAGGWHASCRLASALASVLPGFRPSPVVELVGLGAVLPLRCALYSRPWGRSAMRMSWSTQGRCRWCAASCHVVAGCATLLLENVAVGCVALRFVTCRCVVLRRIVVGPVVSYGCVVVLCLEVLCVLLFDIWRCRVVSGGVVSCLVVCCFVAVRCVV